VSAVDAQLERVFISYDTKTGAELALEAKLLCEGHGIEAWMWAVDRELGALLFSELAEQIGKCTVFLYVCTVLEDPHDDGGQRWEYNTAMTMNKHIDVLTSDKSLVPPALVSRNYEEFTPKTFHSKCEKIIGQINNTPSVEGPAKFSSEAQSIDD